VAFNVRFWSGNVEIPHLAGAGWGCASPWGCFPPAAAVTGSVARSGLPWCCRPPLPPSSSIALITSYGDRRCAVLRLHVVNLFSTSKKEAKALLSRLFFTGRTGQLDRQLGELWWALPQIWASVTEQVFLSYAVSLPSHGRSWETSEMADQNGKPQSVNPDAALGQTSVCWTAWHDGDGRIKERFAWEGFSLPFSKPVVVFTVSLFSADLIEAIKILRLSSPRCRLKVSLLGFFFPAPSSLPAAAACSCLGIEEAASWGFGAVWKAPSIAARWSAVRANVNNAWLHLPLFLLPFLPLTAFQFFELYFPRFFFYIGNNLSVCH